MSIDVADGAGIVDAWIQSASSLVCEGCAPVHFNFTLSVDALVILELLDKINGFFDAVFIIPPAAAFSRVRHVVNEGSASEQIAETSLGLTRTICQGSESQSTH